MLCGPGLMIEMEMPFCWMLKIWHGFGVDWEVPVIPSPGPELSFLLPNEGICKGNNREPANKKGNDRAWLKFLGNVVVSWAKP